MVPRTSLFSGLVCRNVLHLSICEYFAATSTQTQRWRAKVAKDACSKQAYMRNSKYLRAYRNFQMDGKRLAFRPDSMLISSGAAASSWSRVATAQAVLVSFNLLCVSV